MTLARSLPENRRRLVDAVLLQIGWWAAVLGAAADRPWIGPVTIGAAFVLHLAIRTGEARVSLLGRAIALAAVGTLVDSTLLALGVLGFPRSGSSLVVPLWISALWAQFAVAPDVLGFLRGRPALAAVTGAIAGPVAYLGGARLGAAEIGAGLDTIPAVLALGVVWAVALPALILWAPATPFASDPARSPA